MSPIAEKRQGKQSRQDLTRTSAEVVNRSIGKHAMTRGGRVVHGRSGNTADALGVVHSNIPDSASIKLELDIPRELVARIAHAIVEQLGQAHTVTACDVKASSFKTHDEATENQLHALPKTGFLRLKDVLAIIPVSKSTWYQGIASGRYPKPTKKFGPRIAAWNIQDIQLLLEATQRPGTPSAVRE